MKTPWEVAARTPLFELDLFPDAIAALNRAECLSCRVKVLLCIFVFGCSFLRLEPTLSAEVVTIRPGPSGGLSIKDGSGELIVIPIGGGNYWIGSSSDYDRGRVNGFAIEHGFRPAIVAGEEQHVQSFVQTATLATNLGPFVINNISPELFLRDSPSSWLPHKDQRAVSISWIQSGGPVAKLDIADLNTHIKYSKRDTGAADQFKFAEFEIPLQAIRHPFVFDIYDGKQTARRCVSNVTAAS